MEPTEAEKKPARAGWGSRVFDAVFPWIVGAALATGFWFPLVQGYGFVGGDTYNYFFPLKQFYAEGLRQGEIRLWHPGVGNGVPVLGESQTGVFYPPYLIAYRFLSLNAAYSAIFLSHYTAAFAFVVYLARRLGATRCASLLAATSFVYGWFPARSCLEWAIVTGAWMPLAVFLLICWLETGRLRWAWGLMIALAVQLLAGHFQLAFVTQLTLAVAALLHPIAGARWPARWGRRLATPFFLAGAMGLAAFQLLPTWELKVRSQRAEAGFGQTVSFGNVPPAYFLQLVAPFAVYPHAETILRESGGKSNVVEAHLYFGAAPLLLAAGAVLFKGFRPALRPWMALTAIGMLLAEGSVFQWLREAPGFSFFRYPGRYGLMAQLGVAMLAAEGASMLFHRRRSAQPMVLVVLLAATIAELYWAAQQIQFVALVKPPIIDRIGESEVFKRLKPADRVLAIDGNTLALSGAACVPPYLGMGPAEYYAIWGRLPDLFHGQIGPEPTAIEILRDAGVTHLLTENTLPTGWPATLIWSGNDPFLHPRWGRRPNEPLYLYHFDRSPGRAYVRDSKGEPVVGAKVEITSLQPHQVSIQSRSPVAGELVLTDLDYPGWTAAMDGEPAARVGSSIWRSVQVPAGEHEVVWTYHCDSFYLGRMISAATILFCLACSCPAVVAWMRGGRS